MLYTYYLLCIIYYLNNANQQLSTTIDQIYLIFIYIIYNIYIIFIYLMCLALNLTYQNLHNFYFKLSFSLVFSL